MLDDGGRTVGFFGVSIVGAVVKGSFLSPKGFAGGLLESHDELDVEAVEVND